MSVIQNRSKMLLAVNLGKGKAVHLRPKETAEVTDKQLSFSEVRKHLAKGRLEVVAMAKVKSPSKKKVAPAPPAEEKKPLETKDKE